MKRMISFGVCMGVLGCLGGPDDGTDPAKSSPVGAGTETAAEVTVTPRVGFGAFAQEAAAPSIEPVARRLVPQEVEAEEVINIRPVFSPENLKRTEVFRVRMGVQR